MTIKTWQERLEESAHRLPSGALHTSVEEIEDAMQAEIDELRAQLATECRHIKQADGKHPAPCARFCESTAYDIELRQLKAENGKLRAENERLATAMDKYSSDEVLLTHQTKPKEAT